MESSGLQIWSSAWYNGLSMVIDRHNRACECQKPSLNSHRDHQ